jgi:hypothetical protein
MAVGAFLLGKPLSFQAKRGKASKKLSPAPQWQPGFFIANLQYQTLNAVQ